MAQPAFKPDDFDEADPAAFYLLGPGRADMERLADATLVVGGERLPAHSQVRGMERQGMPAEATHLCNMFSLPTCVCPLMLPADAEPALRRAARPFHCMRGRPGARGRQAHGR